MLSLETIMNDTIWVAKMTYGSRHVGTYDEIKSYAESDECRDFDICCNQPDHLKKFYEDYFEYGRKNGFMTVQKYYNTVYVYNK